MTTAARSRTTRAEELHADDESADALDPGMSTLAGIGAAESRRYKQPDDHAAVDGWIAVHAQLLTGPTLPIRG
jgi:hypothetical protein